MAGLLRVQQLPPVEGRTFILGDVHGCATELEQMLALMEPRAGDRLLAVGDLINRGPDSAGVLSLARALGMRSVLGNHEVRLLAGCSGGEFRRLKPADRRTLNQLGTEDWDWIAEWPHALVLPELEAVVIHGGLLPGVPVVEQDPEVVLRMQVLDAAGRPAKRTEAQDGQPWGAVWNGPETVYYGHTPRPEVLVHRYAVGLDTGCVYGFELSAVELPAGRLFRVPAVRDWTR